MYTMLVTDLDDTLYNWIDFFIPSFESMLEVMHTITNIPVETLLAEYKLVHHEKNNVEHPYASLLLPSVRAAFAGEDDASLKVKLQPAFDAYNQTRNKTLQLYEDVCLVLEQLKSQGVAIVGYTEAAKENAWLRLQKLGIAHLFDRLYVAKTSVAISENEPIFLAAEHKPSPATLLRICAEMGREKNEVLYVGDSLTKDVLMAKDAGICVAQIKHKRPHNDHYEKLVAITSWTAQDFEAEAKRKQIVEERGICADYVISSYAEILPLFAAKSKTK